MRNKFKVGEIVICINPSVVLNSTFGDKVDLTFGKEYKIISYDINDTIRVICDKGDARGYFEHRFTSVAKFRKIKLEKLKLL